MRIVWRHKLGIVGARGGRRHRAHQIRVRPTIPRERGVWLRDTTDGNMASQLLIQQTYVTSNLAVGIHSITAYFSSTRMESQRSFSARRSPALAPLPTDALHTRTNPVFTDRSYSCRSTATLPHHVKYTEPIRSLYASTTSATIKVPKASAKRKQKYR